jgi:hypothetical protein
VKLLNKDKKNVGELAEVLIAISFTTARMAKSLIGISQQGQMKKGGKGNGRFGKDRYRNSCRYCRP